MATFTISRETTGKDILKALTEYLPYEVTTIEHGIGYSLLDTICFVTVNEFYAIWPQARIFHGHKTRYVPLRDALFFSKAPIVTTLTNMLRGSLGYKKGFYSNPEDMAILMLNDIVRNFQCVCDFHFHKDTEAIENAVEAVF